MRVFLFLTVSLLLVSCREQEGVVLNAFESSLLEQSGRAEYALDSGDAARSVELYSCLIEVIEAQTDYSQFEIIDRSEFLGGQHLVLAHIYLRCLGDESNYTTHMNRAVDCMVQAGLIEVSIDREEQFKLVESMLLDSGSICADD